MAKREHLFQTMARTGRAEVVEPHLVGGKETWRTRRVSKADIQQAREWYRDLAAKVRSVNANQLHSGMPSRLFARLGPEDVGSMAAWWYDAKHKDKLPYFDQFPLGIIVEDQGTHFQAINFHYLPPFFRAKLLDALYTIAETNEKNQVVRIQLTYGLLKSMAKFKYFKPCFKQYIKSHVKSRFMYVAPSEYDMSICLPTERFVGAMNTKIWADSMAKV